MTSENSMYDTEDILLVLFDAHKRAVEEKYHQLNKCKTNRERQMVIESFDRISHNISHTAVDWVGKNEEFLDERND